MPKLAFARNLAQAALIVKQLDLKTSSWEDQDWRAPVRKEIARIIEEKLIGFVSNRINELAHQGITDRRNGYYSRNLLTEMGNIQLRVPRSRTFSAVRFLRKYARRTRQVDRLILAGFIFGLSTRKVSKVLINILGERVSPALVSRVAKSLDAAVEAFHRRP